MCSVKLLDLLSLADRAGLIGDARLELLSLDHSPRETEGRKKGERVRWKHRIGLGKACLRMRARSCAQGEREGGGGGEGFLACRH